MQKQKKKKEEQVKVVVYHICNNIHHSPDSSLYVPTYACGFVNPLITIPSFWVCADKVHGPASHLCTVYPSMPGTKHTYVYNVEAPVVRWSWRTLSYLCRIMSGDAGGKVGDCVGMGGSGGRGEGQRVDGSTVNGSTVDGSTVEMASGKLGFDFWGRLEGRMEGMSCVGRRDV